MAEASAVVHTVDDAKVDTVAPTRNALGGARIDFEDISVTLKVKGNRDKEILSKVSGCVLPGRLTALMGVRGLASFVDKMQRLTQYDLNSHRGLERHRCLTCWRGEPGK